MADTLPEAGDAEEALSKTTLACGGGLAVDCGAHQKVLVRVVLSDSVVDFGGEM